MRRTSTPMGALHPILFFVFVYGISLFLAFFVCRTVYNTLNNYGSDNSNAVMQQDQNARVALNATALK